MIRGQGIRPSQFVFTYGVGSILEAPNGPRLILQYKDWGRIFSSPSTSIQLGRFEINDQNVSALLGGGKIFRLPTNADMQIPDEEVLFRTRRFPTWALCQEHRILYQLTPSGTTRCPSCPSGRMTQDQAIRFVRACSRGHLDDVDWKGILHRGKTACDGALFDWIEDRGSTLRDITIRCRKCGVRATLQDIYNGTWTCSGRFLESDIQELCGERARVILRNASNLRIPVLETALTIPPRTTALHRLLGNPRILPILAAESSWTKSKLLSRLRTASRLIPEINPITLAQVEDASEAEIIAAIDDVMQPLEPDLTTRDVREKEFEALQSAAIHGAPPRPYPQPTDFEVDKDAVINASLSKSLTLRITPVKRLRVVIAQRGYRRLMRGQSAPRVVETFYKENQNRWYVGLVVHGEGIFVDLPQENFGLNELEIAKVWRDEFQRKKNYLYHPVFVWWHTLSHRLIDALAIDSGYSSASIRERIYIKENEGNDVRGGVLLYTSQRGGDGSLGGLIALVPEFGRVLSTAMRNINSCSNDPLCSENDFNRGKINGAACYACLFLSETSCEFGNSYLDRNLLRVSIL